MSYDLNFSGCELPLCRNTQTIVQKPVSYNCFGGEAVAVNLLEYGFKALPENLGNDGTSTFQAGSGTGYLQLTSSPFTVLGGNGNDHIKYYREAGEALIVNRCWKQIRYLTRVSGAQTFDFQNLVFQELLNSGRVRNIDDDLRLACSLTGVRDQLTGLGAGFLLTNNSIYAYYERSPKYRNLNDNNNYAAFFAAKRVAGRDNQLPLEDYANLELEYQPSTNVLRWKINSAEVWNVPRVGVRVAEEYELIDYGGAVEQETPFKSIVGGIGNFDFLDAALPNNYSRSLIGPLPGNTNNSALVQLDSIGEYAEIDLNIFGQRTGIADINNTFLINETTPILPDQAKRFGQGEITRVKRLALIITY